MLYWKQCVTMRVIYLIYNDPFAVNLEQIEEIREAEAREAVGVDPGAGCASHNINPDDGGLGFRRRLEILVNGGKKHLDGSAGQLALGVGAGSGPATLYRVRRSWGDARSQLGAFENLASAKALADKHPGYCVFDAKGERMHPAGPGFTIYTVVRGDYLWSIARKLLGKAERYKEIKALNGLTSDAVYIGQQLKLPEK